METFRDERTGLVFPAMVGEWRRHNITKYPVASTGISVIYQLRGWLGGCKISVSVDVYDKGIKGIPPGPDSPFVLIELQNCMHIMFPDVPAIEMSEIESFFECPDDYSHRLIGELDGTCQLRFASRDSEIEGKPFTFSLFLRGHCGHFLKVQVFDFTCGKSHKMVSTLLVRLLAQL